ncbi:hypothetical protein [Micromonospora sp. NPDC004551]|uniref:hypothetical protein n=1 Tax=Micromonospora sp. NPDC004551 TaxID=3154284 RepID=UPI0033B4AA36
MAVARDQGRAVGERALTGFRIAAVSAATFVGFLAHRYGELTGASAVRLAVTAPTR